MTKEELETFEERLKENGYKKYNGYRYYASYYFGKITKYKD